VGEIGRHPARAGELLPVVVVAVRSLRAPERRGGLAGVAKLLSACPELQPTIATLLPELSFEQELPL
jgi:hypothetical protein